MSPLVALEWVGVGLAALIGVAVLALIVFGLVEGIRGDDDD